MKPYPKITFIIFSLLAICFIVNAQKLPRVQAGNMHVPSNVKIDGNITEWGQFQAFNKATDINYSVANDNENLYLVVQATIPDVISRILNGGITVSVVPSGKKDDKGAPNISYPVSAPGNKVSIYLRNKSTINADSLMNIKNRAMETKHKIIRTSNITGVDTLISVYNTDNIRVAERFDSNLYYNYELAIPLKYLGITASNAAKFAYHIKINEVEQSEIEITRDAQQRVIRVVASRNSVTGQPATDFWGEYTLAK
jgi:hypothetical protein